MIALTDEQLGSDSKFISLFSEYIGGASGIYISLAMSSKTVAATSGSWFFGPCQEFCCVILARVLRPSPKSWIPAAPLLLQGSTEGQTAGPCPTLCAGLCALESRVWACVRNGHPWAWCSALCEHTWIWFQVYWNKSKFLWWMKILLLELNWPASRDVLTNGQDREKEEVVSFCYLRTRLMGLFT